MDAVFVGRFTLITRAHLATVTVTVTVTEILNRSDDGMTTQVPSATWRGTPTRETHDARANARAAGHPAQTSEVVHITPNSP